MPFLRATGGGTVHELRSSRNLIGTSPSKCDVVVRHAGVRELHALLSLTPNRASATLVPFSVVDADGVCFVNSRAVSLEGARVVHGDEITFGTNDAPASFIFELTPQMASSSASPTSQRRQRRSTARNDSTVSSTASFRRALDTLRGDPLDGSPTRSSIATATRAPGNRVVRGASSHLTPSGNEQLGKFLLDASSDSLLSEFVERKLRQSAQSKRTAPSLQRQRAFAPMAMEPPPSLSASNVSSMQSVSGLDDSILNRRTAASNLVSSSGSVRSHAPRHRRGDSIGVYDDTEDADALALSTAERNAVEMEKLRLSQQLREVNSVLTGETAFQSSYLASSITNAAPLIQQQQQHGDGGDDPHGASNDSDDDDDDELPAMVERKLMPRRSLAAGGSLSVPVTPVAATPVAAPSSNVPNQVGYLDDDDEADDLHLNDSLPGFSEPVRVSQRLKPALAQVVRSLRESSTSTLAAPPPRTRQRTALHQQLIDQTLRLKRRELRAQAFVRWRRGLRVQAQNRQQRAQQLRALDARLVRLRRNRMFAAWRTVASVTSQVLACRVDAFQARSARCSLERTWLQWRLHAVQHTRRCQLLTSTVSRLVGRTKQQAFYSWTLRTREHRHREQLASRETELLDKLDARMTQLARGSMQQTQRAWRKWSLEALLASNVRAAESVQQAHAEKRMVDQYVQQQGELRALRDKHTAELERLRGQLADKNTQLLALQRRAEARDAVMQQQQHNSEQRKLHASHEWSRQVERFLEGVVQRCDRQIAQAGGDLEQILALAEQDPSGARFVAARVLVDVMLEQKVHNSGELVATHEQLVVSLRQSALVTTGTAAAAGGGPEKQVREPVDTVLLSANATFLRDMVQQRITRLHQLLSAVAKLAATAIGTDGAQRLDAVKLHHSSFLTDAICEREQRHVQAMTSALWSLSKSAVELSPPAATA